jgi:hypothetical protein
VELRQYSEKKQFQNYHLIQKVEGGKSGKKRFGNLFKIWESFFNFPPAKSVVTTVALRCVQVLSTSVGHSSGRNDTVQNYHFSDFCLVVETVQMVANLQYHPRRSH